jgi:hypothetical protein
VAVVGGGPAGLEAAATAAARGHDVTLYESSRELGGRGRWLAALPGQCEIRRLIDFQTERIRSHRVRILTEHRVNARELSQNGYDAVIVASGSKMDRRQVLGSIAGPDITDLVSEVQRLLRAPDRQRGLAVLFDQTQTESVYAAMEILTSCYDEVVVLSPRATIGTESPLISLPGIIRRIQKGRVTVHGYASLRSFDGGVLTWGDNLHGRGRSLSGVTKLIYTGPRVARDGVARGLLDAGIRTIIVGDALAPRSLLTAVHEGHAAAIQLDS